MGFRRTLATAGLSAVILLAACAQSSAPAGTAPAAKDAAPSAANVETHSPLGSYLAGRFAYSARDISSAAEYMAEAFKDDSSNRALLQRTLSLLVADGRITDAVGLAPQMIALEPDSRLGNLLFFVQAFERAPGSVEALAYLAKIPRDGVYALLVPALEAWNDAATGKIDQAFAAFAGPGNREAFAAYYSFHMALLAERAGRSAVAEENYKKAMAATTGGTLRVVEAYGAYLEHAGRIEEARSVYEGYAADNPSSVWVERVRARLAAKAPVTRGVLTDRQGIAEALFDAASAVPQESGNDAGLLYARLALYFNPDFDVAYMLIGEILESLSRPGDALKVYRAVKAESPFYWAARLRAAAILGDLKQLDEAIAELRKLVTEREDRIDAAITLGDLLRQSERYGEAVSAYDTAIARIKSIEPGYWSMFYARGIALERTKQWPPAEADFLKALELQPDQPAVLNYLGYSWVEQGTNLAKARAMIERAVELRPSDAYIIDSLGWALFKLGDYEGAVDNLEKAVELMSNDPVINDHLGDAYWQVHRQFEARYQWERALVLKPDDELVEKVRRKLAKGLTAEAKAEAAPKTQQ